MTAPEARRTIAAGGHSVLADPPDGKPLLVLLRMAARGAGLWDAVWAPLGRRYRVAQFDLPMPTTAALAHPREVFGALAEAACDVAEALGHARFSVFGWNGGCHVALRAAASAADRIASCLLLGPFHAPAEPRVVERGLEFLRVMYERGDPRLYAYYWFLSGLSPRFVAANFDRVEGWVAQRVAGDRFLANDPARALAWMRALRGAWLTDDELASIRCPTLILAHSLDLWHAGPTAEMAQALHARIPGSRLHVLTDVGSLVLLEDPGRVVSAIDTFTDDKRRPA